MKVNPMSDEHPIYEIIPVLTGELYTLVEDDILKFNGCDVIPHYHFMNEIMWFRRAEGLFSINDDQYKIKDNTLIFVPALVIHDMFLSPQSDHLRYLFQFEADFINDTNPSISSLKKSKPLVFHIDEKNAARIDTLLSWCNELFIHNKSSLLITKLLASFIELVFSFDSQEENKSSHDVTSSASTLIKYLYSLENSTESEITTAEASAACGWSKSYFSRLFKSYFGMTFKKYMLLKKIKHAIRLLSSTELKIADIAENAGFTDSAYFCMKFKIVMGCSPATFRHRIWASQNLAAPVQMTPCLPD